MSGYYPMTTGINVRRDGGGVRTRGARAGGRPNDVDGAAEPRGKAHHPESGTIRDADEGRALSLPGDSLTSAKAFNRLVGFLLRVDWGP